MRTVTSRHNPIVRAFRDAAANAAAASTLLLDGSHLVGEAHAARLAIEIAAVTDSHLERDSEEGRLAHVLDRAGVDVVSVPDQVFAALSPVKSPSGIVAIARHTPASPASI